MKKVIIKNLCLLFCFGIANSYAQEATTSSGGDASGSGGTVAYSVGQVAYTYETGTNGDVNQGVQQPYEIFTVGIEETIIDISFSVFPNPSTDYLTLKVQDYEDKKMEYQLFDMQGKLLINEQILVNQTQINMNNLPPATYFINVVNQENKRVQSFKIIKN